MAGQIVKARIDDPFARIPNEFLQRNDVSARAKGVLSYLLSLPSDWVIYKTYLHKNFKEGRDAISAAFDELIELGYIAKVNKVDPKTMQFKGVDYMVYAYPITENPKTENPKTENKVLPNKIDNKQINTNTPISPKGDEASFEEDRFSIKDWEQAYFRICEKYGVERRPYDLPKDKLKRHYDKFVREGRDVQEPLKMLIEVLKNDWQRKNKFRDASLSALFNPEKIANWTRSVGKSPY